MSCCQADGQVTGCVRNCTSWPLLAAGRNADDRFLSILEASRSTIEIHVVVCSRKASRWTIRSSCSAGMACGALPKWNLKGTQELGECVRVHLLWVKVEFDVHVNASYHQ